MAQNSFIFRTNAVTLELRLLAITCKSSSVFIALFVLILLSEQIRWKSMNHAWAFTCEWNVYIRLFNFFSLSEVLGIADFIDGFRATKVES
jgi:hypothetical protein